jgi:hypothetical protein
MSAAEQKYGIAPIPDSSVTYQPDVIVVGGGADAIRAQSSNGFIWTIDGHAPHAAELVPGKVFFLTNRAVGRVLDVRKDASGDLVVIVGPVNLEEIAKEAHLDIQTPIDFGEAIAYSSPDIPRILSQASASTGDDATIRRVALDTEPNVSNLVNFKVAPIANRFGIGIEATSNGGGLKLYAQATLHMAKPKLFAKVDISPGGGVKQAWLSLAGGAGMTWQFTAGTDVGRSADVNGILQPDTDFSIQIVGLGPLPVSLTVRHVFQVKTALAVKNATLSARGTYTFTGAFTAGIVDGHWTVKGPSNFVAEQNMMKTTEGVSLGAEGLNLTDDIKVIAGVGVAGFAAGPYFRVTSALGVFKGSSIVALACKEATIDVKFSGGVGYVIPKVVTNFFNSILRALNIKYRIDGEGSLRSGNPVSLYSDTSTLKGCNTAG